MVCGSSARSTYAGRNHAVGPFLSHRQHPAHNNEVWESVFYKDGEAMTDFALWPREAIPKPTYGFRASKLQGEPLLKPVMKVISEGQPEHSHRGICASRP